MTDTLSCSKSVTGRLLLTIVLAAAIVLPLSAQETRSMIFGRVLDPSAAVVAGASVTVTNLDTNVATRLTTNQTGYYEAPLLLPGNYQVAVEAQGFRTVVRKGITLPISTRAQIDISLQVGAVAEQIAVTAEAPLLETNAVSSGQVVERRSLEGLPTLNNNPTLLAGFAGGVQAATGLGVGYTNPAFTLLGVNFTTGGNVGGNDFSVDGVPNNANIRRMSFQPHSDAVMEFKVETSSSDASVGHTSGASFNVMTKSGTNQFHGSASLQHWRNEWNAARFFTKQNNFQQIAAAMVAGDTATADRLRSQNLNPPGHSNNYSATFGGPVIVPKVYNGKDHSFFFFSYNGVKDRTVEPRSNNKTIPTLAERDGDFSDLLAADPVRYQIYDPLTVRLDPARPTHYIRDPLPGNFVPLARRLNPAYKPILRYLPAPNNSPTNPKMEPLNNYIAGDMPWTFDYRAYVARVDHQLSEKHRFFGRVQDWTNFERTADWLHNTVPGAVGTGGARMGVGSGFDWVYTPTGATVVSSTLGVQLFDEDDLLGPATRIKPSSLGLPSYLDDKAGDRCLLPTFSFSGYTTLGASRGHERRHRNAFTKLDVSHVRGTHTFRVGFDQYQLFKNYYPPVNSSGAFAFDNTLTRKNDDTFTPSGSIGHSWAAFMMGLPSQMTIGTYDSVAIYNGMYGWYGQDNWRLTPKLTVNLGLRMEYETAPTERYNRAIGYFVPGTKLPITDAAQAAYAQAPLKELPASQFSVLGGNTYVGAAGASRSLWQNEVMLLPRLAAAYQLGSKTVMRASYGIYYDTLNVRDFSYDFPNQFGYSRDTVTTVTNDFGQTFQAGDPRRGITPLSDPFPIRSDGTRFNMPVGNALGSMAEAGRSFTYFPWDMKHARQQRWRIGFQHQLGAHWLVDVGYAGSYSDRVYVTDNLRPLPSQYWADGLVRNDAVATDMNSNVTNPFYIGNLNSLKTSDPLVYADMSSNSFFTSKTIRKNQLLRAFPQMTGVSQSYSPIGEVRTDALEARVERRFANGFNLNASYTRMRGRSKDFFLNEFDPEPSWRDNGQTKPHRLAGTSVFELPLGKGKPFLNKGWLALLTGGFQVSATYEYQPGPLLSFGNVFYYGDNLDDIKKGPRTLDHWFNTANFETNSSKAPSSFHRRVFPTQIDGLRGASTNLWNGNIQREFRLREAARLQLRFDVLNLFNHTIFDTPETNPLSTNFGKVTDQAYYLNRYLQIQAKIRF